MGHPHLPGIGLALTPLSQDALFWLTQAVDFTLKQAVNVASVRKTQLSSTSPPFYLQMKRISTGHYLQPQTVGTS